MSILSVNRAEYESRLYDILQGLEGGFTDGNISSLRLSVINLVKVKLDELVPEGEGVVYSLSTAPNKTNPIDLFINSHLDESAKDISLSAPLSAIYPIAITGSGTAGPNSAKYGYIELPTNFLRLSSLKMTDWKREVCEVTPTTSREYKKQSSIYTRSGSAKPRIAITWKPVTVNQTTSIKQVIEYYSVDTAHTIEKLLYIPSTATTDYDMDDWITNNPNLIDSLAWMCAGKIMQITGQMDAFKYALEQVKLSFQNL